LSSTGLISASLTGSRMLFPMAFAIFMADLIDFSKSACFRELFVEKLQAPFAKTLIPAPVSLAIVTASI